MSPERVAPVPVEHGERGGGGGRGAVGTGSGASNPTLVLD